MRQHNGIIQSTGKIAFKLEKQLLFVENFVIYSADGNDLFSNQRFIVWVLFKNEQNFQLQLAIAKKRLKKKNSK